MMDPGGLGGQVPQRPGLSLQSAAAEVYNQPLDTFKNCSILIVATDNTGTVVTKTLCRAGRCAISPRSSTGGGREQPTGVDRPVDSPVYRRPIGSRVTRVGSHPWRVSPATTAP